MLGSLLLALDDTPGAAAARDFAFALARRHGVAVTGAFVLDRPHSRDLAEPVPAGAGVFAQHRNEALARQLEGEATAVVKAARAAAGDLRFEVVLCEEAPEPALLAQAAGHDLIVIGRDSTLGREACDAGLCPTIEALIADGVRPLLVVPPGFDAAAATGPVLVGHDGGEAAMRTVQLFALLGLATHVPVRLLDFSGRLASLTAVADYLRRHGCAVEAEAAEGDPHDTLLEEAARIGARALVLGADQEGGLRRLIFGSATARLLRAAPCPVFVHG